MIRKTSVYVVFVAALCGAAALAFAAADWSSAERKFDEFKREHEQLRRLTPEETRKIVAAVCDAQEEERQSVGRDASQRVRDKIEGEYEDLEELKQDTIEQLDAVLADSSLKDKHSKAKEHRGKVTEWWTSIEKMTRSLRGANHPVVAYMLEEGRKAHRSYQNSSNCDVWELDIGSGKADCIKGCEVIELKPNNSKAIGKGKAQAQRYADELEKKGKAFKALVDKNSKFAQCSEFDTRVDCYRLCPTIDERGEFRSIDPDWDEGC